MTDFLNDDESIRKYLDCVTINNRVLGNRIPFKRTITGEVNIYSDLFRIAKNKNSPSVFRNNSLPINLGSVRLLRISEEHKHLDDTLKNTNGFPSTAYAVELEHLDNLQTLKINKHHAYDRLVVDSCQGITSIENVNTRSIKTESLLNLETLMLHKDTQCLYIDSCPKIKSLSQAIQYSTLKHAFRIFTVNDCGLTSLDGLPKIAQRIKIVDFALQDLAGLDKEIQCEMFEFDLRDARKNITMLFDQNKIIHLYLTNFFGVSRELLIAKKYLDRYDYKEYVMDFTVEMIDAGLEFSL